MISIAEENVKMPDVQDFDFEELRLRIINIEIKQDILIRELDSLSKEGGIVDNPDQRFGPRTYAQHGDDLIALAIFDRLGIEKPSYIDIGAHHPTRISNTALMYERGSRGINVEANPNLFSAFVEKRPEDINLNVGVGVEPGSFTFYMVDKLSGLNTFDLERVAEIERASRFRYSTQIDVPVRTLPSIIEEYWQGAYPDFLTIDIEGLDEPVLRSIDFSRGGPKLICVEANSQSQEQSLKQFMSSVGYKLDFKACVNLFFTRGDT